MRLPTIEGIIRRRMLVNYRVRPEIIQPLMPVRFRPKLYKGYAIAGICLIRLEHVRPKHWPAIFGLNSENAAHRVAVLWDDEQGVNHEGVFVLRRDTDSEINHLMGGRIFPGEQNRASFMVDESGTDICFAMKSQDGKVSIHLIGATSNALPDSSIFPTLAAASSFFEPGALGYSATRDGHRLDGIVLETKQWRVEPLHLERVHSSFFANEDQFPPGTIAFDHALIMRNIAHEWHSAPDLHI